jgi:hypothetical protein
VIERPFGLPHPLHYHVHSFLSRFRFRFRFRFRSRFRFHFRLLFIFLLATPHTFAFPWSSRIQLDKAFFSAFTGVRYKSWTLIYTTFNIAFSGVLYPFAKGT